MLTLQHIFNFSAVILLIMIIYRVTGSKAVCSRLYAITGVGDRQSVFSEKVTFKHIKPMQTVFLKEVL